MTGRVKDCYWYDYGSLTDAARIQYGYDRASNRTYRKDPVAQSYGKGFDELYGYDGLHRLNDLQRGTLNAPNTAITNGQFAECWSLDPTGNWKGYRRDDDGTSAWDLVQSRTANKVNEIGSISKTIGPSWAQPAYDAAGNMTTIPQPADPMQSYDATYDAWNRLTKLVGSETDQTVAEYQYDARRFRTVSKNYTAGVLSETRHHYYNLGWQDIEERLGTTPDEAAADRQFVWGLRYIDDCILRDRSTNTDGTLDERLYALQDANWNVDAVADGDADVHERYAYSAYGTPAYFTAEFTFRASSAHTWEILYGGYRYESAEFYHIRQRIYPSLLGSWVQRDPKQFVDGMSLYGFVAQQPINRTDPLGDAVRRCKCHCSFSNVGGEVGAPSTSTVVYSSSSCKDACATFVANYELTGSCTAAEEPLTQDQGALSSICKQLTKNCPGCTTARCERAVNQLLNGVENTWLLNIFGLYIGTDTCQRWVFEFERQIPDFGLGNPCVKESGVHTWNIPGGWASPRHAAYRVEFCDGTIVYFDNGALGGADHIFSPEDVPAGW